MRKETKKAACAFLVLLFLCGAGMFLAGSSQAEAGEPYDYIVTDEEFGADGTDGVSDA